MSTVSVRGMLVRGMLAGLIAGGLALLVSYFLGEPRVDAAIAYEHAHGGAHEHGEEIVGRTLQSTAGLATGVLVYGVAIGGIAALVTCYALGRVGPFGPRGAALLVSGAALACGYVVPFLKYPANPPGVGEADTIGRRTALYFLLVALSVALGLAAVLAGRSLAARVGGFHGAVAGGALFVAAVGLAYGLLPAVDEVPRGYPATLLWQFRLSALAVQATLWGAFGLVFGELAARMQAPRRRTLMVAAG